MSFYRANVDPVYLFKRAGTDDDPFLHLFEEGNIGIDYYILKEIPDHTQDIKVTSRGVKLTETDKVNPEMGEFRVDYSEGVIYVHDSMSGRPISVEYHGKGMVNIPPKRIRMPGGSGDPIESLQDALDRVDEAINVLGEVGNLDFKEEYDSETSYEKWNFVTYKNKTFVALKSNKGVSPDNDEYWGLVSSGVGASGVYDSDKTYDVGDLVSDEEMRNLYVSKVMDNDNPLSDEDSWELVISLDSAVDDLTSIIDNKIDELNTLKDQLIQDDQNRDDNETERDGRVDDALAQMELFKQDIQDEENKRSDNEDERRSEERVRQSSEESRVDNEAERKVNESARKSQEEARQQNMESVLSRTEKVVEDSDRIVEEVSTAMAELDILKDDVIHVTEDVDIALDELDEFVHKKDYDPEVTYKRFNIVRHENATYMAIQDTTDNEPPNEDYWRILSQDGRDGTELTVEGIEPDEDRNISLESLGLANENYVVEMEENIQNDYNLKIGNLSDLRTGRKENVVEAINELKRKIDDVIDLI